MTASKCSKCHVKDKVLGFPSRPFDHWCDQCLVSTPLSQRIRKTSKAEKRKLAERQQREVEKKVTLRAKFLKQQELKRVEAAKNKATSASKSRHKKGADLPFTLNLELGNVVIESPKSEIIDYDTLRRKISEVQDPTIFDEELPDD